MVAWLIRKFVPDYQNTASARVRYAVCRLCGYLGICLNLFLFASKYAVGLLVGSVAIRGDAINNLTDAASNIVSILSFHLAEKPADKEHPYGHQRTETIAAFLMGMVILVLGFEMLKESIQKILEPGPVEFKWSAVIVLALSIAVKLIMYTYNHRYAKVYDSDLLEAYAVDSRNDVLGTSLVLASAVISPLIHYDLDGIMGVIVSGIIFFSAYDLLKDVITRLIGEAHNDEVLNQIEDIILENPMILDVHDVIIHSYGPQKTYATAHAEVDGSLPLMTVHGVVDQIEREIQDTMNIEMVIHVDPVALHDEETIDMMELFERAVEEVDPDWNFHDFRIQEQGDDTVKVYFDLVIPYEEKRSQQEIEQLIVSNLPKETKYILYMRIEHPYS